MCAFKRSGPVFWPTHKSFPPRLGLEQLYRVDQKVGHYVWRLSSSAYICKMLEPISMIFGTLQHRFIPNTYIYFMFLNVCSSYKVNDQDFALTNAKGNCLQRFDAFKWVAGIACKNRVVGCWHGYLSGARCRFAYGPADATATHCLLLQWNPAWFWYRLTQVIPDKVQMTVNGCVCGCECQGKFSITLAELVRTNCWTKSTVEMHWKTGR